MKRTALICTALALALAACSPNGAGPGGAEAPAGAAPAHTEAAGASSAANAPAAATGSDTPGSAAGRWHTEAPAGTYTLDKAHASLLFRVNHLGFSNYTARFKRFDAQLRFDPADPTASQVTAAIDARSLETDYPDPATHDFNAQLQGEQWLHTAKFPQITFRSTKVEPTGPAMMRIEGELALHGVTRPVTLDAKFNGGYAGHPMDPHARIGFSARGSLARSEFGIDFGIPAPGSTMGVGDAVEVIIEAEFTGPPLADAAATAASRTDSGPGPT